MASASPKLLGTTCVCCSSEEVSEIDPVLPESVDLDLQPSHSSIDEDEDSQGSEDSVGRVRTLSQRRCSVMVKKALSVDREIMRGIALKAALRGLGHVWRFCPADLPMKERSALWALSEQVESFDTFLSHSWRTHGRWKVVALTLRFGWPFFVACSLACILLPEILSLLEILPLPLTYQVQIPGDKVFDVPFGGWGSLGYLPDACGRTPKCFLDVTSRPADC
ncbi:unnamed protein product [Symbiodinium sp. CCMP2592]|nr:unnamed protein product [Symbiodinium sp. CCMP2592]